MIAAALVVAERAQRTGLLALVRSLRPVADSVEARRVPHMFQARWVRRLYQWHARLALNLAQFVRVRHLAPYTSLDHYFFRL